MDGSPKFEHFRFLSSDSGTRYRVVQLIGIGGNSHVYLVEAMGGQHQGLLFALKLFVRISDETRLGRFEREVEFLKRCSHPAIMRVYDSGKVVEHGPTTSTFPYVIADYLPRTLFDAMRSGLSMVEKVSFVLQLLSAAAFLDQQAPQIVHRDIKPENIFVRGRNCILGDFGLMKVLGDDREQACADDKGFLIESTGPRLPRYYRTRDLVEYCKGKADITTKSDIFQLGLVFAEMFTGRNPLRAARNIFDEVELDPLGDVPGSQASAIKGHLQKMLASDPTERPSAYQLFDPWEGQFREVVSLAHSLEGRAF